MLVFRIASTQYIDDLTGEGARRGGGRWNRVGVPVLYTGANIALCAWEYWVHLKQTTQLADNNFSRISISIPDGSIYKLTINDLPDSWPREGEALFEITDKWLAENQYLCLAVPSAVIPGEYNYIINPAHSLMSGVSITEKVGFSFDNRAFNKLLAPSQPRSFDKLLSETLRKYFPN